MADVPFFQLQRASGVMNVTETCLQQPAGPTPDLCEYQPEAALVACQAGGCGGGTVGAHLRFSALTWSSSQLTAVAAPDQGCSLLCHVPQRSFAGSADSIPFACVFALASSRCSLLSPLLPVFDSILLSHCLLLVPGGAEYRLALEEIPGGCVRLLNGGLDELSCLS